MQLPLRQRNLFFQTKGAVAYPVCPEFGVWVHLTSQVAAHQMMPELQPWIEREKTEHVRRVVRIVKRGFQHIEELWEKESPEARAESLVASALDKHDQIIRRNLGMNETQSGSGTLNLDVLVGGGRRVIAANGRQDSV